MFYADMLKSENVIFPPVASFSQSLTHIFNYKQKFHGLEHDHQVTWWPVLHKRKHTSCLWWCQIKICLVPVTCPKKYVGLVGVSFYFTDAEWVRSDIMTLSQCIMCVIKVSCVWNTNLCMYCKQYIQCNIYINSCKTEGVYAI